MDWGLIGWLALCVGAVAFLMDEPGVHRWYFTQPRKPNDAPATTYTEAFRKAQKRSQEKVQ